MESWLKWASELNAIAQNGLTFTNNEFDVERYTAIKNIVAEMLTVQVKDIAVPEVFSVLLEEVGYATPKVDVEARYFRIKKFSWSKKYPMINGHYPEAGLTSIYLRVKQWLKKLEKSLV